MTDLSHLSLAEYEKISSVLKRDRELRSMEEARIRQLKQELAFLRKRAALKPGLDPLRNCSRCLAELGRILNRGALCPRCLKKVCKDCRHFGDENHEWLCIYCFKQMQLKAISGEWMQDFSKLSVQRCAKDPPGDQLRKVLHESQRKSVMDMDVTEQNIVSVSPRESGPPKPPRSFQYEQAQHVPLHTESESVKENSTNSVETKLDVQRDLPETSPKALLRMSPWNGIDPEPTIPLRVDKSRPFGTIQTCEYPSPSQFRERQSSDEGHCTIGCRSRSTSSEVVDDNDNLSAVPSPRKRLSPLKKQQAIPEKSPVENQQSSVDTTDSGVCSPGLKVENSNEIPASPSPLAVSPLIPMDQETVEFPSNRPRLLAQRLHTESSSSSECESDYEQHTPNKKSDILFRKVTLKKRKASPCVKSMEKKHSAVSTIEENSSKPLMGLKNFYPKCNFSKDSFNKTNHNKKLTQMPSFYSSNISKSKTVLTGAGLGAKKRSMLPISNNKTYADACAGRCSSVNSEAQTNGNKIPSQKDVRKSKIPALQEQSVTKKATIGNFTNKSTKLPSLKFTSSKKTVLIDESTKKLSQETFYDETFDKSKTLLSSHNSSESRKKCLVRRASLPNKKTSTYDWFQSSSWKCQSLEDWLWYIEEQPYKSRKLCHFNCPDDYKFVYVSTSSTSVDSDGNFSDDGASYTRKKLWKHSKKSKIYTKVTSDVDSKIKTNCENTYNQNFEWEFESVNSDHFNMFSRKNSAPQYSSSEIINNSKSFLVEATIKQSVCCETRSGFKSNLSYDQAELHGKQINEHNQNINLSYNSREMKLHKNSINFSLLRRFKKSNSKSLASFVDSPSDITVGCAHKSFSLNKANTAGSSINNYDLFSFSPSQKLNLFKLSSGSIKYRGESDLNSSVFRNVQNLLFILYTCSSSCFQPHHRFNLSSYSSSDLTYEMTRNKEYSLLTNAHSLHCFHSHFLFMNRLSAVTERLKIFCFMCQEPENYHTRKNILGITSCRNFELCLFDKTLHSFISNLKGLLPEYFHLFLSSERLKLSLCYVDRAVFICFDLRETDPLRKEYTSNYSSISSFRNICLELINFEDLFLTREKRNRFQNFSVISPSGSNLCCEFNFPFLLSGEFCNLDWRRDGFGIEKDSQLNLNNAANAFHFAAFLSDLSKRGNGKSNATGWRGEHKFCIATRRVIDLNLRALECGREVLELADLTLYLGWTAGTRTSGSTKLGAPASIVNTFFYHVPPVTPKPEASCLLRTTHSRLLFQRPAHVSGKARMIASKLGETSAFVSVKSDNEKSFLSRKSRNRLNTMKSGNEDSSVTETSFFPELVSHEIDASGLATQCMKIENESEMPSSQLRYENENINKICSESTVVDSVKCVDNLVEHDFNDSEYSTNKRKLDQIPESEILPYVKYIFNSELDDNTPEDSQRIKSDCIEFSELIDINERVDCHCNKPCDVPSSPSVVDATVDARGLVDDGEIFSSGDELDKIESDTDSQDTVIEGEAYKRIRSVAIKEKILHANEELFGTSPKESYFVNEGATKLSENISSVGRISNFSKSQLNKSDLSKHSFQECDREVIKSDSLCLHLDLEKSDSPEKLYAIDKHLKSFKKGNQSAFHPVIPKIRTELELNQCVSDSNQLSKLSSYKTNFSDNVCSSESSDNGSDGEELVLSDVSTSSDEATYIAPSASFHCYNHPVSYRLHTIVEESCEESEKSSRGATPTSRASSDFEYYDKSRILSSKTTRKYFRKNHSDSNNLTCNDSKTSKGSAVYAVLATSRLEKYFRSGLLEGEHVSYPEDDLTDESGGVSSDDESTVSCKKNKLRNQLAGKFTTKQSNSSNEKLISNFKVASISCVPKKRTDLEQTKIAQNLNSTDNDNTSLVLSSSKISTKEAKESCSELVSDDEAKYIMSHLMQHISNNTEVQKPDVKSEVKDISPMLKILESEIARLMLTVSPASLSAGEPSSSCSSTIGSNNSDYGSDTLESAEDSTDDELNNESIPENQVPLELTPQIENEVSPTINEPSLKSSFLTSENVMVADSTVSEETLYICKQLMASLKKIADSSDIPIASDEPLPTSENNSAKQYIADQIVSLMQTVSASHNNSPQLRTFNSNNSSLIRLDCDINQDRSDSDSPPLNDEKRDHSKSKTPSESGSETTISASISIPSYDDSDRTPTESEISHEMDELYALLENNGATQDLISTKFPYDPDTYSLDKSGPRSRDSPISEDDAHFSYETCDNNQSSYRQESSLLCGAASKLESLLPISIEERIARYKDAFFSRSIDYKESDFKSSETRINVILPQPSMLNKSNEIPVCKSHNLSYHTVPEVKSNEKILLSDGLEDIINSSNSNNDKKHDDSYSITSVKIISHNTYPLSSAIHKILSSNIDSQYMEHTHKLDYKIVNILDDSLEDPLNSVDKKDEDSSLLQNDNEPCDENERTVIASLPKVMNPKEKASSENDLLVANYRAKSKGNKVSGTKSVGNISELENIGNKSTFRDTGYYSFKSSEESFLSFDDSTASQTSTASLTQYRSLTSTETIPEEEESCVKTVTKMSLSSSNIPDAVTSTSPSKSSTLPLSLRNKLSATPGGSHRTRSSFFSTSGVLRKLTLLRDLESGNSLRSSPHGRLRMRNRSLSGGSEDGKQRKTSLPQISVSECTESHVGRLSAASSEKESSGLQDDEIDQAFAYHCRSQMSLSSFGGRCESVTSVYSAAGGGRYGTVTVTGEVLFGLSYNYKTSSFEINVKECRNLAAVDTKRNRSDPYVKVYLLPDRTKSGKRKTKVKKHTLSPVFDERLKFSITPSEMEIRTLWLSVWHSDRFGRNDFLGEVMLPLSSDSFENTGLKWYPLQERMETLETPVSYKGDLILALKFVPPDVTSRKFSKKPGLPVKGALEVLVREARNLMATRSNGTSDPFCKSYLLPDKTKSGKQKTQVFKKSCNPKWNHTFVYDDVSLDDLRERCLELTIWDYDKITSNDFLGGVRLCLGTGKYQGRDVDWMDSVGEERSLWYTMLERPNTWVDGSLLLRPNMQNRKSV